MNNPITKTVYDAVDSIFREPYNIRRPKIMGSQNNVFFLECGFETFVFKFSHKGLVKKNEAVSKILNSHGIRVPEITAFEHNANWFELYKCIPGHTLYEWVSLGMKSDCIKSVYGDILESIAKMSKIDARQLPPMEYRYTHQVAKANISNANNPLMGGVFQLLVRALNYGPSGKMGLYHTGLTPKNIIVSDAGHFVGIVDVDEAAVCNINYAFGAMAAKYQQLGYDINDLFDQYESIAGQHLDRPRINAQVNMNNLGKKILWAASNKSCYTK